MTLRTRLALLISGIISVILFGQAVVGLSGEVTELDARIATRGTILAQSVAAACERDFDTPDPQRFDALIDQLRRSVELVSVSLIDRDGLVRGHSDPALIGTLDNARRWSTFGVQSPVRGLMRLFEPSADYWVTAPIHRGERVLGFVQMHYRSDEVSRRAAFIVGATAGWALLWLLIGAGTATLFVRHITRPLRALTVAVAAVGADRLDDIVLAPTAAEDEVGTLQRAFIRLVEGLRAGRVENTRLLDELTGLNTQLQRRVDAVTADLRAAHDHLEAVIGSLGEGVVSCTPDGEIVQVNEAVGRQLNGLSQPAPGQDVSALLPCEGERLRAALREVIEHGRGHDLELTAREVADAPTTERRLVLRLSPLKGKDRVPHGVVIALRDVTEERRLEAQLRRQDRLVSLGTLAAGLAHELGNHMHIIHGFANVLLKQDGPCRDDVQAIHEENKRAIELLRRFLQFARPEEGHFEQTDLAGLAREALSFCRVELKDAGVTVEDQLTAEPVPVRADRRMLLQVLVNLMLNAADAMRWSPERRLTVSSRARAETVELCVCDTGPGVPEALRERIFDPFFTTKPTGTGLGLAIAGQIVAAHEGRLSLFSQEGAGSTFVVSLPRCQPPRGGSPPQSGGGGEQP